MIFPVTVMAEEVASERRLVVIEPIEEEWSYDIDELTRVINAYLVDLRVSTETLRVDLPEGALETVLEYVATIARERGVTYVVWLRFPDENTAVLSVSHVSGDSAMVRTIDLADEPPAMLRRTIGAVVRTVVDAGVLEESARIDLRAPPPIPNRENVPEEVESEDTEAPFSYRFGIAAGYGLRWVSSPGPAHHAVSVSFFGAVLDWIGFRLAGRLGIAADLPVPDGGVAWRASLIPAVGLDHSISVFQLVALLGLDLEWLWGNVELSGNRGSKDFSYFGIGLNLRGVMRVRLWRGLLAFLAVEGGIRPRRKLYLLRGEPVVSTGLMEIGFEVGLAWNFL